MGSDGRMVIYRNFKSFYKQILLYRQIHLFDYLLRIHGFGIVKLKEFMRKILALLTVFLCAVGFNSCGDDDDDENSVVGIWKAVSYSQSSVWDDYDDVVGGDSDYDNHEYYFYFTSDFKEYVVDYDPTTGTSDIDVYGYSYSNGSYYTELGNRVDIKVSGNKMSINVIGLSAELIKVSSLPSDVMHKIETGDVNDYTNYFN